MWQPLPRAHNLPIYFTLYAQVLIHFRNFLDVPYSLLAKKCYICSVRWQIPKTLHHGKRLLTPISARRFFGTSHTFSSVAVNIRAVDGWWLWVWHWQYSFLKFRADCFFRIVYFTPGALGALMAIFLHFPIQWRCSQYSQRLVKVLTYFRHSE